MRNTIIAIGFLVFGVLIGLLVGYINSDVSVRTVHYPYTQVHNYDYILELKAIDSVEQVFIYDNNHKPLGNFNVNNPDSLKIILNTVNFK
jgi:hypothetical protein